MFSRSALSLHLLATRIYVSSACNAKVTQQLCSDQPSDVHTSQVRMRPLNVSGHVIALYEDLPPAAIDFIFALYILSA